MTWTKEVRRLSTTIIIIELSSICHTLGLDGLLGGGSGRSPIGPNVSDHLLGEDAVLKDGHRLAAILHHPRDQEKLIKL